MMPGVNMATPPVSFHETPLARYSRLALGVTVGCAPLYVVRWHIGPLPTTLLENLTLLTIALYAGACIRSRRLPLLRQPIEVPMVIILLAAIAGIAVAPNHVGALGNFRADWLEPAILFYLGIDLLRTNDHFRTVLLAFGIGATGFACLNLRAFAIAFAHHDVEIFNAPEALYTSPNSVAMFLEPPVALAAGFALFGKGRERAIAIVFACILTTALILTLSRGGWLTLSVLAALAVASVRSWRWRIGLFAGALLAAFSLARIPWVAERLAQQLDPHAKYNTFADRVQIWGDTLRMLKDHPIFGAGLHAYSQVEHAYLSGGRRDELEPHNLWLAFWSDVGLLGMFAFAWVIGYLLWRGWRSMPPSGFYRAVLWGTSAAFVTIVVHGLVDTPYFGNDLSLEFWMVAALLVAALYATDGPVAARLVG